MRVAVEDRLVIGWQIHSFKPGERSACFAIKSTYRLRHGTEPVPIDEPEPVSGDRYQDEDPTKSLLYPSDIAPFKPKADVVVLATAHAPGKRPVLRLPVRIKVGPMVKTLAVIGPRAWRRHMSDGLGATGPAPFVRVPISYEYAFGGVSSKKNPVGRGVDVEDLPQIEDPRRLVASPHDVVGPAGFGPLAASWQPREGLVGTFDERWRQDRWPWFPEDFDYGYFNAAPPDQQIEGYLMGDEDLAFENLHPEHGSYRSRLPGRRARCFLDEGGTYGRNRFREVPLNLDTLWLDLDREKMVLVWRGHVPVRTIKLKEVQQILAWTEPISEPPRPVAHCPVFLAELQRVEDAENEVRTPEEAAVAEAEEAAADAAFDKAFAEFDTEMSATDRQITSAAAALEAQWVEQKASMIASGIEPGSLDPRSFVLSPLESLRATVRDALSAKSPDAAIFQQRLADVEQLEAEASAMDATFAVDFPPAPTRDDVLAAIARGESLAETDLTGMDFSGRDLSGVDFREASLHEAILADANLQGANLTRANLSNADLRGADLTHATLDEATLNGAKLAGALLTDLRLNGTDLAGLNLAAADFSRSSGKGADFSGSDLTQALFVAAVLPDADFSRATLDGSDFHGATIPRADLDGAKGLGIILEDANLAGASASGGADFAGGNFRRANAAGAVFAEALLDNANFSRAILVRAQFSDASLNAAVFDRADLSKASFDGAILRRAALTNANLIQAGFDQADLTEADLKGSNLYEAGFWEARLEGADLRGANVKGTSLV
jgi:uncharacterized protein YjbI with pentapeptide repeats